MTIDPTDEETRIPTLGRSEYLRFCETLRVSPDESLTPAARASSLPAWICGPLIATEPARDRLRAWLDAGQPAITADAIVKRMWFMGSGNTRNAIQNHLLDGHVAPPAVWYLIERVATIAIGADASGFAHGRPPDRCEKQIVIIDQRDPSERVSLFLHELAHVWLVPAPLVDMTDLENVVATGLYWEHAAHSGHVDERLALAIEDEKQACRLAKAWGATGIWADAEHCARGPQRAAAAVDVNRGPGE